MRIPIIERLLPVSRDSGFQQADHHVWGGSVIRAGGQYHLFASRWPRTTGFPDGYRTHSEIVRAVSDDPLGPYVFREVVVSGRGGAYWDGKMCHNPKIVQVGDTYVLYYIGSASGSKLRKVGYAWADAVEGPWRRRDEPLPLGEDANNPAPYVHPDGSVLLAYRDLKLHMQVARADAFDGPYEVVARDVYPQGALEDPDLYTHQGVYHMVMEDNRGVLTGSVRHGGRLISTDGLRWTPADPVKVYTHTIQWTDGGCMTADRRERPELFNDDAPIKGRGEPTHLLTGVYADGRSWCLVQAIAPVSG